MNDHRPLLTLAVALLLGLGATAMAQSADPAAKPAEEQAEPVSVDPAAQLNMTVKIVELIGSAQYRTEDNAPWQPVTMDSTLPIGCVVRTGLRSTLKLRIGPNADITVRSLSIVTLAELELDSDDKTIRTRLGKKYGKMRTKVHHIGDLRNDFQIATPGTVLAVKGSEGEHEQYGRTWQVTWVNGTTTQFTTDGRVENLTLNDITTSDHRDPTGQAIAFTQIGNVATPVVHGDQGLDSSPKNSYSGGGDNNDLREQQKGSTNVVKAIQTIFDDPDRQTGQRPPNPGGDPDF